MKNLKVGSMALPNLVMSLMNKLINYITYRELELLICLNFPMVATRMNKEGVSLSSKT